MQKPADLIYSVLSVCMDTDMWQFAVAVHCTMLLVGVSVKKKKTFNRDDLLKKIQSVLPNTGQEEYLLKLFFGSKCIGTICNLILAKNMAHKYDQIVIC